MESLTFAAVIASFLTFAVVTAFFRSCFGPTVFLSSWPAGLGPAAKQEEEAKRGHDVGAAGQARREARFTWASDRERDGTGQAFHADWIRMGAWSARSESVGTSCAPPTRRPSMRGIATAWAWTRRRERPLAPWSRADGVRDVRVRDRLLRVPRPSGPCSTSGSATWMRCSRNLRAKGADVAEETQDIEGVGQIRLGHRP